MPTDPASGTPLGELLYLLANASAGLCWLPLIVAPASRLTQRLTATPLVPAVFAVLYVVLVVFMLAGDGVGGMESLAALRRGFASDTVLLLAWVHYLCFDMVVGHGVLRDSQRLGLPALAVAPCLVLTFLLGPVGLLAYLGLRWSRVGSLRHDAGR